MANLEETINSIATIIVSYCGTQGSNPRYSKDNHKLALEQARADAIQIMQAADHERTLTTFIEEIRPIYKLRIDFLNYLTYTITALKTYQDKKTPFTPEELVKYKQQIAQLFLDLRQLLNTNKSAQYSVKFGKFGAEPLNLNGLFDNGVLYSALCKSGAYIELLLSRFNINRTSSDTEINKCADEFCDNQQKDLLISDLQAMQIVKDTRINELEVDLKNTKAELQEAQNLNANMNRAIVPLPQPVPPQYGSGIGSLFYLKPSLNAPVRQAMPQNPEDVCYRLNPRLSFQPDKSI